MTATAKNIAKQGELVAMEENAEAIAELLEREERMERHVRNAFYQFGLDLAKIRDNDLYKLPRAQAVAGRYSFTTFEEYVEERWAMSKRRADQMIESASALHEMESKTGKIFPILPSSESHVRELLKLQDDEDRAAVWQSVVERGETITAKVVAAEVDRFIAQKAKEWLTIDEWVAFEDKDSLFRKSDKQFNKQDNDSIEWAQWSWNPITGCKHDCPYCYARDIATRFYPQKFEPSIYPLRFAAPANTPVPVKAAEDTAFRNVFTGSMADIFGRWVPNEWIERVLQTVADNDEWNFLFLTKFPQRVHEFGELPSNAWMGTTVDCQDRVAGAEKAFAKMGGGIKWLSVEPMLTPLKFKKLEMFDWVVIGGASKSSQTPAWVPPMDWIVDLHAAARRAQCAVYYKSNAGITDDARLREFPWEEPAPRFLPEPLKYLNIK